MHELSIAQNIVEIAESSAKNASCSMIHEIEIEVGSQSGVVREALEIAMESAKINTMLENAVINIIEVESWALCNNCQVQFMIKQLYEPCPFCNQHNYEILKGKELRVKSIQAE